MVTRRTHEEMRTSLICNIFELAYLFFLLVYHYSFVRLSGVCVCLWVLLCVYLSVIAETRKWEAEANLSGKLAIFKFNSF